MNAIRKQIHQLIISKELEQIFQQKYMWVENKHMKEDIHYPLSEK